MTVHQSPPESLSSSEAALRWSIGPPEVHRIRWQTTFPFCGYKPCITCAAVRLANGGSLPHRPRTHVAQGDWVGVGLAVGGLVGHGGSATRGGTMGSPLG